MAGRIRLATDVSNWLRPDAETSPERLFCHCYAREGERPADSGLALLVRRSGLEPGRASWTLPLDAVRLGPEDDRQPFTYAIFSVTLPFWTVKTSMPRTWPSSQS